MPPLWKGWPFDKVLLGIKEEDNGNSSAVVDDPYSIDGDVCCVSMDRDTQEWILDTSCTYHMCP